MSYTKYTKQEFGGLDGQINIMALFGNGLDIQLMEYLKSPYRTSYQNFYNYLCYKNFSKDNIIFDKMTKDKEKNEKWPGSKQNWSDFESGLIDIIKEIDEKDYSKLNENFRQLQIEFSNFLNEIITPTMLAKLGKESSTKKLALNSFTKFLLDLKGKDYDTLNFQTLVKENCLFNWRILNFNFTSMLDNIIHLDKDQFDPYSSKKLDGKIDFWQPSVIGSSEDLLGTKAYLLTEIIHPHGYQNVPTSMLFGIDNVYQVDKKDEDKHKQNKEIEDIKFYLKTYWGQNTRRHKYYFKETNLFIIYGMSIGVSDHWWWSNILRTLLAKDTKAELIIYNYNRNNESDETTIGKFIKIASNGKFPEPEQMERLHKKIAVVQYDSETKLHAFKLDRLD